jgi:Zn-dependent protease with chaperone function
MLRAMSTLPAEGHHLNGISPRAYEHPADRAATAALATIPYLDPVARRLIDLGYDRALRQMILGSSVRLGEDQLPELWRAQLRVYKTLDVDPVPELFLTTMPLPNAAAVGAERPVVVVNSGLVSLMPRDQLTVVLAHEAGHVLSDHVLYGTVLAILILLGNSSRLPLPLLPLRHALLEWSRAAELTCDRAAALITRDPLLVCRALMTLAGGAEAEHLDLDAFMRQSADYRESGSGLERLTRLLVDIGGTHPMPVRRVHELMSWVQSGDYDRIVGGEYPRRDEPGASAREEAAAAADHYAERFRSMFDDAGHTVQQTLEQLGDWLRRD